MERRRLGELLLDAGLINADQLEGALREQGKWGGRLGEVLVKMHIISEAQVLPFVSRQLGVPVVDLANRSIADDVLSLLPEAYVKQHQAIPFAVEGKFLDVAMRDPLDGHAIDEIRMLTRLNVRAHLGGAQSMQTKLEKLYSSSEKTYTIGVPLDPDAASEGVDIPIDFDVEGTTPGQHELPVGLSRAHNAAVFVPTTKRAPSTSAPTKNMPIKRSEVGVGAPMATVTRTPVPPIPAGATQTAQVVAPTAPTTQPLKMGPSVESTRTTPALAGMGDLRASALSDRADVLAPSPLAAATPAPTLATTAHLADMIDLFGNDADGTDTNVGHPQPSSLGDIDALRLRVAKLETWLQRDEVILRQLLSLLVEKKIATHEEVLQFILGRKST